MTKEKILKLLSLPSKRPPLSTTIILGHEELFNAVRRLQYEAFCAGFDNKGSWPGGKSLALAYVDEYDPESVGQADIQLITLKNVSVMLQVSVRTLHRLHNDGQFKFYKLRDKGKVYMKKTELIRYINSLEPIDLIEK